MVKISVIIPVYNVEAYLAICLDSVLQQSFTDFEVIAVNDGSTDGSGEILAAYAEKDKRLRVITQQNAGVSAARNAGLRAAQGEYISFVDGDDYLAPETYQELWQELEDKNWPEILVFSIYSVSNGVATLKSRKYQKRCKKEISFQYYIAALCSGVCDKLFSRRFLEAHHIQFAEGVPLAEDGIFAMECGLYRPRIGFVPKAYYYYRLFRENSTMSSASGLDREFLGIDYLHQQAFYQSVAEDDRLAMDIKICGNLHYRYGLLPKERRLENLPYLEQYRDYLQQRYVLKKLQKKRPYLRLCRLIRLKGEDKPLSVWRWIFSLQNSMDKTYKVLVLFGVKIRVRRKAKYVDI